MTDEKFITNSENNTASAEELMKKFDKDSKSRNLTGIYKTIYNSILIAFSAFIITLALVIEGLTEFTKLPLFLGLVMFLGFLKFPACEKDAIKENYFPIYDIILAILSLFVTLYYVFNQNDIIYLGGVIETKHIIVGIVAILLLFELCRRAIGVPLMVVAGCFIIYAIYWLFSNNPATVVRNLL